MSRSSSRRSRSFSLLLALAVLVVGWLSKQFSPSSQSPPEGELPAQIRNAPSAPVETGVLQSDVVVRIADGDSFELRDGGRVRLVGVDCPEQGQAGGREAARFTKQALLGKTIEYRLCAKQTRDRYGRGLGFIYLREDGRRVLFNTELIRQGYARVYESRDCQVDSELWNTYYDEARRNKRGLFATLGEVPDASSYRRQNERNRRD